MTAHPRLAELAGISQSENDDAVGTWPLNAALVLLGAAIMATAFYFLDPQDLRWTHNPWTYAIATPVSMLLLSIVLSTFVSRLVEKSMQLAFLLSVLVHLLLLIYAVNIVIFSRMWPEVLESFDHQRHQLQRETLQASQYHRSAVNSQNGQRPDHLRFVPTQHEPTEIEDSDAPALRLAKSEVNNLVSPSPRIELLTNPHLRQRERVVPALSAANLDAASLSRSALQQELAISSNPEQLPTLPMQNEPAPPSASTADVRRQSADSLTSDLLGAQTPFTPRAQPGKPSLNRAIGDSPDALTHAPRIELPREAAAATTPRGARSVDVPQLESTSDSAPLQHIAAAETQQRRSSSVERWTPTLAAQDLPSPIANRTANPNLRHELQRSQQQWSALEQSPGASETPVRREIAGGNTGPAAPSSMPVYGADSIGGSVTSAASELVAPRESSTRTQRGRASSSMLELDTPQSHSWNGTPSLAGGVAGRSPSQLALDSADGNAASADVAGLTGNARPIERSTLAIHGQGVASSPTQPVDASVAHLLNNDNSPAELQANGRLDSGPAAIRRSAPSMSHDSLPQFTPTQLDQPLEPSSTSSIARATAPSKDNLLSAELRAASDLAKSSGSTGSAPSLGEIALPAFDSGPDSSAASTPRFQAATGLTRDTRSDSRAELPGATPMDIDAAAGLGGISPTLDRVGLLLPRRGVSAEANPAELETQRFARQNVGGPVAAGQRVALPTPAFQQRLERLQDRNPQDDTSAEPQTELAIERGLEFLAQHQRADGSWRLQDFDTQVLMRSDTAATALSLLAFQGAGYTHKQFKYAEVVDKAILFLRQHQQTDGDLYIKQDPASDQNAWLYSHGIAALALCEAYGMTQDPELKAAAQKSIDFMVRSQDLQRGGWRYRPGVGTDTSVTGWFMMAFKSGQLAGLDVPEESFAAIRGYLEASQVSAAEPHLYRYNPFAADTPQQQHGLKPTAVMTSVGLLMRLYTGWQRDRREMQQGADYLLERLPEHGTRTNSLRDTYYWYYATQVVFHMGGERWDRWHDALYPLLIEHQVTRGKYAGSWDPMSPTPDLWSRYGGRLYVTTLNLLSLEVSYRHLPLYDATAADRL